MDVVPIIVHLVGADTSEEQLASVAALCAGGSRAWTTVLHLGPGTCQVPGGVRVRRVHDGLWPRLALARAAGVRAGRMLIYHVWTERGLRALPGRPTAGVGLVIDVPPTRPAADRLMRVAGPRVCVCRHAAARRAWGKAGVAADDCAVIPPIVEVGALRGADRADCRRRLELAEDEVAVLALPPATRATGTFQIAWAAMVLEKVRPDVRLVLPSCGSDLARVRRLARDCQHEWFLRDAVAGDRLSLGELLAAADIVVSLPAAQAPLGNLLAALVLGKRCVVGDTPATHELLSSGFNFANCSGHTPATVARAILTAIEEATARHPQRVPESAHLRREEVMAAYQRVYELVGTMVKPNGATGTRIPTRLP